MTEATIEKLSACSSALLCDAMDGRGALPADVRAQTSASDLTGIAYTVEMTAGDNLGLHVAVARAHKQMVIVGRWITDAEYGAWGSVLASAAAQVGIAGFVTNGWIRDREALEAAAFPVFARGACPRKTGKQTAGTHGRSLVFGDVVVSPGDFIRGDEDGVVVVPRAEVEDVLARAWAIEEREAEMVRGIREGKTTIELLGLGHLVAAAPDTLPGNVKGERWDS